MEGELWSWPQDFKGAGSHLWLWGIGNSSCRLEPQTLTPGFFFLLMVLELQSQTPSWQCG